MTNAARMTALKYLAYTLKRMLDKDTVVYAEHGNLSVRVCSNNVHVDGIALYLLRTPSWDLQDEIACAREIARAINARAGRELVRVDDGDAWYRLLAIEVMVTDIAMEG